jgi:CspA family cold shock protein
VATGRVKVVNDKGFCFITLDQPHVSGKADVFCHFSTFEKAGLRHPEVGDRYQFEVVPSDRGIHAVNIEAVL